MTDPTLFGFNGSSLMAGGEAGPEAILPLKGFYTKLEAMLDSKLNAMNVFEAVKQNLTTRQAAEMYGIRVNRHGMAVCPFHNDKNPSMKVDKRFHCFACQADGDAVDFVSRLFGLPSKAAAMKLADEFGISYDNRQKHRIKPHI